MKIIENQRFDKERTFYESRELFVKDCAFDGPSDGESAFKESREIETENCFFNLRYPFWHGKNLKIRGSEMTELCRAAIWYSEHVEIRDTKMHGIKALRECSHVIMENCDIVSPEFGWSTAGIQMKHSTVQSEYFMMRSRNLDFRKVRLKGKYSFQYIQDAFFENCVFDTKDAFWHSENVTVKNSVIKGEYLAWYSVGLTLINCKIIGTQPFCYCKNLTLVDCEMIDTDFSFEKSEVQAVLTTPVDSIKNPYAGWIQTPEVGELIFDDKEAAGKVIIGEQAGKEFQSMIKENKAFAEAYIRREIPQLQTVSSGSPFFLAVDCQGMLGSGEEAIRMIQEKKGVRLLSEVRNGGGNSQIFWLSVEEPRTVLKEKLQRLKEGITAYEEFCVERC